MTFHDQLIHTIGVWNKDPIEDEWLFEKFRKQFVDRMSAIEAFEAIDGTVDILLRQSDESTAIEVLQTLISLARQSETTEIPSKLLAEIPAIALQFSAFETYANNKLQELLRWYRL
jgi:hypothetical protein